MSEFDVERAIEQAVAQHQAGDIAAAESIYRRVIDVAPDDGDALHLLGVITMNSGRVDESVGLLQRAAAVQPDVAEFHLDLGRALVASHQPQQAADAFAQASRLDASLADAWFLLGKVRAGLGQRREAADALRRTVELLPDHPAASQELADVLMSVPDFDGAVAAAQAVVRLRPGDPAAEFLLGNALRAAARMPDAADAYRRALAINPKYVEAMLHLASVYWLIQRKDEAVELCRDAVRLNPANATSHYALGVALEKSGRYPESADAYRHALRLDPSQPNWRFDLAVVSGESLDSMPAGFVARLFDEYAPRFEEHLVRGLEYQAPDHVLAMIKTHVPLRDTLLDVIDLGCGTGLCGRLLRPLARLLVGVDLSPRMIEQATQTGVYDRLIVGDVAEQLLAHPQAFDLIAAADVLNYLGDLCPTLAAAREALRPGRWMAFTVEAHDHGEGFALQRTRRFTHSMSYVQRTATASGLEQVDARQVTLRVQERNPVSGWVVLLRKPPSRSIR